LGYRVEWVQPEDEYTELQRRMAHTMEALNAQMKRANDISERIGAQKMRLAK